MKVGVEDQLFLAPLILVLLAQADHSAQRLDVEAIALGLGIDLAQIPGERRLLLLQPFDARNDGTKLIFG
jgi:hypothetical protein